jgi:hypothetical protein
VEEAAPVRLAAFLVAFLAMLIIHGFELLIKAVQAIVGSGPWPLNTILKVVFAVPITLLTGMEKLLLGAISPMIQEFDQLDHAAGTLVAGLVNEILHIDAKTNTQHKSIGAIAGKVNHLAQTKGTVKTVYKSTTIDKTTTIVKKGVVHVNLSSINAGIRQAKA